MKNIFIVLCCIINFLLIPLQSEGQNCRQQRLRPGGIWVIIQNSSGQSMALSLGGKIGSRTVKIIVNNQLYEDSIANISQIVPGVKVEYVWMYERDFDYYEMRGKMKHKNVPVVTFCDDWQFVERIRY